MIETEVLLDDLLAGGDGDLDGALNHRADPLVHRLLDGQLDQLDDLRVFLEELDPEIESESKCRLLFLIFSREKLSVKENSKYCQFSQRWKNLGLQQIITPRRNFLADNFDQLADKNVRKKILTWLNDLL